MAMREVYRTSIDHPFDSSKGRLDGHPGRLPNKYSPPLDSSKGRLDGYPGRLPNEYKYRGQALSSQRMPARRKSALNTNVHLIGQTYIPLFLHTYKSLHPSRANA